MALNPRLEIHASPYTPPNAQTTAGQLQAQIIDMGSYWPASTLQASVFDVGVGIHNSLSNTEPFGTDGRRLWTGRRQPIDLKHAAHGVLRGFLPAG